MGVKTLTTEQLQKFRDDGFLVVSHFLTDTEVSSLRGACHRLVEETNLNSIPKVVFTTADSAQGRTNYFLESGDKISFFFEEEAIDENGELKVDKHLAMNKLGHALHWHVPEFRAVSFSQSLKAIAKQLCFQSPAIVQSMYIFKQPGFGGEVVPHKDSTFLSTEPESCVGFWFALEDATEENGCLWFAPGSHKTSTKRRFVRNPDENGPLTIFTHPPDTDDESLYVQTPVKKGSLVLINGQVDHKSKKNESKISRHIYTFHLIEQQNTVWNPRNWLQPTEELSFTGLYNNS